MNILNKIGLFFRRFHIRSRFLILFIASTVIPILISFSITYRQNSRTLRNNVNETVETLEMQTSDYLSEKLKRVISDSKVISRMDNVRYILHNYSDINITRLHSLQNELQRIMSYRLIFNDMVTEITLYGIGSDRNSGITIYAPYSYRFRPTDEQLKELMTAADDGKVHFFNINSKNTVILFKTVPEPDGSGNCGYLCMRLNETAFSDIFQRHYSKNMKSFILNKEGVIVSAQDDSALAEKLTFDDRDVKSLLKKDGSAEKDEYTVVEEGGSKKFLYVTNLVPTELYLVTLVPESYFRMNFSSFLRSLLIVDLVLLLLAFVSSQIISGSITEPIKKILYVIDEHKKGNFKTRVCDSRKDEIGVMAHAFDEMSGRIENQMKAIKEEEIQKRELEIQALQAQINPHFMANTLNLISNIAADNEVYIIENIASSMEELLRDCVQNKDRLVKVRDEVSMLNGYISIMNYRTFGKFKVHIQIEDGINDLLIPNMILQPIVENSILHGIMVLTDRRGQIVINGVRQGMKLIFTVTDNGVGMSREQIKTILENRKKNTERSRFTSIGIGNVNERIHLMYGDVYGISIESVQGVFTTVTIQVPVVTEGGD